MDVTDRIFEKLDTIEERLSRLCDRVTKLEAEHKNHIDNMIKDQNKKLRNRDYVMALLGIIIAGVTIVPILLSFK